MAIDVSQDRLLVTHQPFDATGNKVEAEQQIVIREMTSLMGVNVGKSATDVNATDVGAIPLTIEAAMPAEQAARGMRSMCYTCKHFDVAQFQKLRALWARGTPEQRRALQNIRVALLTTGNSKLVDHAPDEEGQIDADATMALMGVCKALTVVHSEPVIVHPISSCPDEVCDELHPDGLHRPKGIEEERHGSKLYDDIMHKAQGKVG